MSNFWINALIDVLLVIFVVDCVFMGLIIMMQRSKQEGLGAAFGGSVMQEWMGAGASAALVKATVWAAAIFFILSISLARLYSMRESSGAQPQNSAVQQELEKTIAPVPAATNAAPATPSVVTPTNAPSAASTNAPAPVTPAKTPTH